MCLLYAVQTSSEFSDGAAVVKAYDSLLDISISHIVSDTDQGYCSTDY